MLKLPPLGRLLAGLLPLELLLPDELPELPLLEPLLKLAFGGVTALGRLLNPPLLREGLLRETLLAPLGGAPFGIDGLPELMLLGRSPPPLRETLGGVPPLCRLFNAELMLPPFGPGPLLCDAELEPPRPPRLDGDGPKLPPGRGPPNDPDLPPEGWLPDGRLLPSKDGRGRLSNPPDRDGSGLPKPDPRLWSPLRTSG